MTSTAWDWAVDVSTAARAGAAAEEGTAEGISLESAFTAQTRACAPAVPVPSLPVPSLPWHARWSDSARELLDKPGTLLHAQPPTFRQAQSRHHECAGHHQAPLLAAGRLAWGYFHMACIKSWLNYVEWATDSPLRFGIHLAVGLFVWLTLAWAGYLR